MYVPDQYWRKKDGEEERGREINRESASERETDSKRGRERERQSEEERESKPQPFISRPPTLHLLVSTYSNPKTLGLTPKP